MISGFRPLPAGVCGILLYLLSPAVARAAEKSGAVQFHKDIQPILTQYCYDCHGDGVHKGNVTLDEFKSDEAILTNRDLWLNALKYVRAGIMPPDKKPKPTDAQKLVIANWIKTEVFGINPNNLDPGRVTVRRLNRVEYRNSIRDLMGVDYDTSVEFPADDTGYGFDDIGDVLTISPMLLEKYVAAANNIVAQAVPTVSRVVPETTIAGSRFHDAATEGEATRRRPKETLLSLPFNKPATLAATFDAPNDGSYQVTLNLATRGNFNFDSAKCQIVFKMDGEQLLQKDFGGDNKSFPFHFNQTMTKGNHEFAFELHPLNAVEGETNTLVMRLVDVTIVGPTEKQFATKPKNYTRFFTRDVVPTNAAERRRYAQEILRSFAGKAFRRPVDEKTVNRLATLAESIYTQPGKSFEAGMAYAMQAVIASPRFLFRMEENEAANAKAGWSQVDEYSLASRLSYFLWSTMPDDELFRLAARGELRKNLPAQVKRMLADDRSDALIQNFVGQWLQTRDMDRVDINARAVLARDTGQQRDFARRRERFHELIAIPEDKRTPEQKAELQELFERRRRFQSQQLVELDSDLRRAMRDETEKCFGYIVRQDRPVLELLDADYTFLNEKLARHYGLTNLNLTGGEMRRVTLPTNSLRGGVLTDGSVLVVTSNPDRTSPVKRGLFILDNILGTPAPPPPANVPALEVAEKDFKDHEPTLREALSLHREKPLCASCHNRMDPIGLAFENFNALGMWRQTERKQPIETAGKLITGETFDSVRDLKHLLVTNHRLDFYRCLTEKFLTYAVGRGMEYYDVETMDKIVQRLDNENGRFSALLNGVIESAPFQKMRLRATETASGSDEPVRTQGATSTVAADKPKP